MGIGHIISSIFGISNGPSSSDLSAQADQQKVNDAIAANAQQNAILQQQQANADAVARANAVAAQGKAAQDAAAKAKADAAAALKTNNRAAVGGYFGGAASGQVLGNGSAQGRILGG